MGFLDVLRGKRAIKQAAPTDRVFAMTTAQVSLEMTLGLKSKGTSAIVFQPLATADFEQKVGGPANFIGQFVDGLIAELSARR